MAFRLGFSSIVVDVEGGEDQAAPILRLRNTAYSRLRRSLRAKAKLKAKV